MADRVLATILSLSCRVKGSRRAAESSPAAPALRTEPQSARKNRGRVDIIRQTAGRGGKVVTVIKGFAGIGLPEKERLAKAMQKACGTGGTVKDGRIENSGGQTQGGCLYSS
jgi:translation initiation factor 1